MGEGEVKLAEKLFLASPHMSEEGYEQAYVKEAFDTNWIAPLGENVNRFEQEMAEYVGVSGAAALSSGTAAIHMALKAAGVGRGDVVLCSSLTFSASANPIVYQGAVPVFVDSDRQSWNMDPKALAAAFSAYPHAKAVIAVDLYGQAADMDAIASLCKEHGAVLIEDAAEALGSTYRGKRCGSLGDYGILSFNGNKIITTSGGGMLLSDDTERLSRVRFWSTQSREPFRHYEHKELGYNYRMSNVCAGIGRGQLRVLDLRVSQKRAIFQRYAAAFAGSDAIEMMPTLSCGEPNHWLSCITLRKGCTVSPTDLIVALERENIESRPIWKPMHLQPYYRECDFFSAESSPVADDIFARGICLPSDTKMTQAQQERVVDTILRCFA